MEGHGRVIEGHGRSSCTRGSRLGRKGQWNVSGQSVEGQWNVVECQWNAVEGQWNVGGRPWKVRAPGSRAGCAGMRQLPIARLTRPRPVGGRRKLAAAECLRPELLMPRRRLISILWKLLMRRRRLAALVLRMAAGGVRWSSAPGSFADGERDGRAAPSARRSALLLGLHHVSATWQTRVLDTTLREAWGR